MTKVEIRKAYLQRRLVLSETEYLEFNRLLCENFFAHVDLSHTKVLHTFLPIEKNKEPNTRLIIDRIRSEFSHIRISVPRVNSRSHELENFYFEEELQLERNAWSILEPKYGVRTQSEKIDIVLVPLLAFDQQGHRVGYGKGFYDKFLKNCRTDCNKTGISFFPPCERIDDVSKGDFPLTACLTTSDWFTFPHN